VALESHKKSLVTYALMQGIKESATLRTGPKSTKSAPRVVYRWGKQNDRVKAYIQERKEINRIVKFLRICPLLLWV